MLAVTHPLKRFISEYGNAVLLAVLVHIVILALLLTTKFSQPVSPPEIEPIISFLYQPPPATKPPAKATLPDSRLADEQRIADEVVGQANVSDGSTGNLPPELKPPPTTPDVTDKNTRSADNTTLGHGNSLAQRALNRAATIDPVAVEQDAANSYQQFLLGQQPRLTVDKKYWPVSENPAQQVIAQLDDGKHIVRIRKGVCVIGDPSLDGFEGLMAAKRVPCGDEVSSRELLKQALDKHSKR
ncbi:hypothetical protein [Arsukibacterium indicum]|uniref:Energy transducer TonB n=1 Tax=Arsukibacterium indicum TaxID=2848612 RepID=A0ABS6MQ72_9GAMM|nr:hypothetical protein [Arsukibacterium indicum]MBV2130977.1 hypothetical protein [Arsukibacterium indicum]